MQRDSAMRPLRAIALIFLFAAICNRQAASIESTSLATSPSMSVVPASAATNHSMTWSPMVDFGWTDLDQRSDDGPLRKPYQHHKIPAIELFFPQRPAGTILKTKQGSFPCPRDLPHIPASLATPIWREKEARRTFGFPVSILHAPEPAAAKRNTGPIMVAITSCCTSWNMTLALLESLLAMSDPMHIVLVDDNSKDGAQEKAAAMGIPVISTGRMTGNTHNMLRAWKYFTSYDDLQTLFVVNNDVSISPGTFSKLHRCAMLEPFAGALGPMSDSLGIPSLKYQITDSIYARATFYNHSAAPKEIRRGLPGTLDLYNDWLEENQQAAAAVGRGPVYPVWELFGFVMGFRKDMPITDYNKNILLKAGLHFGQEHHLFVTMKTYAYVCADAFVFHRKSATLIQGAKGGATAHLRKLYFDHWKERQLEEEHVADEIIANE